MSHAIARGRLLSSRSVTEPHPPVAIVGAGFLGHAIAQHLGGPAWLCSRSGRARGEPIAGVTELALDLTSDALDPSALSDAEQLVIAVAPGRGGDRHALYVEGTRRLLARLEASLRRIVFVGSTSALPDIDGWVFEDCAHEPDTPRGRVQRQAEAVVLQAGRARSVPTLVLRLGGLYGPGRELGRIYRSHGDAPLPGHGWSPTNLVHQSDAVTAVLAALAAPAHCTGIVHVVDDDHVPRRRMYEALARQAGATPVQFAEPMPSDRIPRGKRVANGRMKAWLGVRLAHPTHGGALGAPGAGLPPAAG